MKKSILKRCLCGTLAAAMTFSFAACGKEEAPIASKENTYKAEEIAIPFNFDNTMGITVVNDQIYIFGSRSKEEKLENSGETEGATGDTPTILPAVGARVAVTEAVAEEPVEETTEEESTDSAAEDTASAETEETLAEADEMLVEEVPMIYYEEYILGICDMQGNIVSEKIVFDTKEASMNNGGKSMSTVLMDESGCITLFVNEYNWNETTGESTNISYMENYNESGEMINEIELNKLFENQDEYFWINSTAKDKNGNVYINSSNQIIVIDKDGNVMAELSVGESASDGSSGSYINSMVESEDGSVYVIISSYEVVDDVYTSKNFAKKIDLAANKFTDEYPVELNGTWYNGGNGYDAYVSTTNALFGYDFETGKYDKTIDWLQSGFDTTTLSTTTLLSDGRIVCVTYKYEVDGSGYSWSSNNQVINILTKVDPSEIPDKKLITLSAVSLDFNVRRQILEFNKTNELYKIEVKEYSETGDWDSAISKFNNDLIAGEIPDIVITSHLQVDNLISKGLFADLYEFIDNDETMSREDYLPNVLEAYSKNDKLYTLVPSFCIVTLVGKTSKVGDKSGWTVDDYLAVKEANPGANMIDPYNTTRGSFLDNMLASSYTSYVDPETGECRFNSDDFKKLLELAAEFPAEIDYDNFDDIDWQEREMQYYNDTTLLSSRWIGTFTTIRELEQVYFAEPVSFVGYPCESMQGSSIYSSGIEFAITSKAKNPDGAWEFLKYFISDEYQNELKYVFPIKKSAYSELMEEAKQKPYYIDVNGNKVEYENTYWLNNQEINMGVNTDADNEKMMKFIESVNVKYTRDDALYNIIIEDAEAYFSGQKTVDEVAEIIQNRASTYISENR